MRDLSRDMDTSFRPAYHGGIVDVYRPHLEDGGSHRPTGRALPDRNPVGVGQGRPRSLRPWSRPPLGPRTGGAVVLSNTFNHTLWFLLNYLLFL